MQTDAKLLANNSQNCRILHVSSVRTPVQHARGNTQYCWCNNVGINFIRLLVAYNPLQTGRKTKCSAASWSALIVSVTEWKCKEIHHFSRSVSSFLIRIFTIFVKQISPLQINSCGNISIVNLCNEILEKTLRHVLGNQVVHRIMFHQGCSFPGKWRAIRNTHGKETEYFSSFCSLKFLFKWCFCYYNLSPLRRRQGINFWGSSEVLWVFPLNVTKGQKSYENLLTAAKETRPFVAHCKKDMLEWLSVFIANNRFFSLRSVNNKNITND